MTKLYYTESIQVTEIPKYLPNNKVDYEIKFFRLSAYNW